MKKLLILALLCLVPTAASADAASEALLSKMLAIAQADRNQFLNALTESQAKLLLLSDDLAKANAKIKDMEAKEPPPAK